MNKALILVLSDPPTGEDEPRLIINSGGMNLENQADIREAIQILRIAENSMMDALLKPPCPGCAEDSDDCEGCGDD